MSALAAYTDAQVAAALNVSKRTVYRLRKSGALRAIYVGRAVRIPADALAQFLDHSGQFGEGGSYPHDSETQTRENNNASQHTEHLSQ